MQKKKIAVFFLSILLFFYTYPLVINANNPTVIYQTHLKDFGWIEPVQNGEISGTTGQYRRMEAIIINLSGVDGNLNYQVHVAEYGWMNPVKEGEIAGTTGEYRRMEAIIINLENSSYNIKYRVHVQDYGWMDWVNSGEVAGTTGEWRRIEAIQIVLEKKNNTPATVTYQTHLKDFGWIEPVQNGEIGGTTGQYRRMEAIIINLSGVDGDLDYQVHVAEYGWMNPVKEGEIAGTTGEYRRMEAIIINLKNSCYNIKYRVHVQDYGWMDWVNSGEVAGTTGEWRRIEAIQIVLEKKNSVNLTNNDIGQNQSNQFFGIDVSKHQGIIDWTKVKNSGVEFAMIRCAYRGYTEGKIFEDSQFENNIKGAINNKIKVGIYFYSSAIDEREAIEEANYTLNLIRKYRLENYITYPIVIDIEDFDGTRSFSLSVQERTNVVNAFCNTIKNSGFKPMLYSYTYFLENKLYMNQLTEFDTWIADYYGNTWYNRSFKIWQYTDSGQITGINGKVDLNYSYKNY